MTGRYPSEERALARVETLKRRGIWPGVRRHADGTASLLFDPDDTALSAMAEEDRALTRQYQPYQPSGRYQ